MQPVYIKPSLKIVLKQYLKAYLLFSPLMLMAIFADNKRELLFFLALAYYVPLTLLFIVELLINHYRIVVKLQEEGITLQGRDFYWWEEIYDFRIINKQIRTTTQRRGTQIIKKDLIRINEKNYDFNHQYLQFSPEEVAEIIMMYRDRLGIIRLEDRSRETAE